MWKSSKLAHCRQQFIPEYAWLYGLADANGSFELTNPRVIWGLAYAIRPQFSVEDLIEILNEFHQHGLLFTWDVPPRRFGHWTGSDARGRLPAPTQRWKYPTNIPLPPKDLLEQYLTSFSNDSRVNLDLIYRGLGVGVGVGVGLGVGGGQDSRVDSRVNLELGTNGTKHKTIPKPDPKPDLKTAPAAFLELGFETVFGQKAFQAIFIKHHQKYLEDGYEYLTDALEATIQECQAGNIGIPPQFYEAKHTVEMDDKIRFQNKHHRTPL
jgi:hypothetical protein